MPFIDLIESSSREFWFLCSLFEQPKSINLTIPLGMTITFLPLMSLEKVKWMWSDCKVLRADWTLESNRYYLPVNHIAGVYVRDTLKDLLGEPARDVLVESTVVF